MNTTEAKIKHTPAPWGVWNQGGIWQIHRTDNRYPLDHLATVMKVGVLGETLANAELMASGPEMANELHRNRRLLEAGERLQTALKSCGNALIDRLPSGHPDFVVVEESRAALAAYEEAKE